MAEDETREGRRKRLARDRAKRYYEENREHCQAVQAVYRETHRDELREYFRTKRDKEKKATSDKLWNERNKDRVSLYRRARYVAKKQEYVDAAMRWQAANPEKARAHATRKNHRRRGVPFTEEAREYSQIILGDPCSYCREKPTSEIDHIVAVSKGGNGEWTNLTGACSPCNKEKSNKSLLMFLLERK